MEVPVPFIIKCEPNDLQQYSAQYHQQTTATTTMTYHHHGGNFFHQPLFHIQPSPLQHATTLPLVAAAATTTTLVPPPQQQQQQIGGLVLDKNPYFYDIQQQQQLQQQQDFYNQWERIKMNGNGFITNFQQDNNYVVQQPPAVEVLIQEAQNVQQLDSPTTITASPQLIQVKQEPNELTSTPPPADDQFQLTEAAYSHLQYNNVEAAKSEVVKPFKCDVCHKAFGRLSHVRRHQLLHTGEKPFECEICHEKFTRVENRTRHMAIHTGERRYNCEVCGKGFSQLNRLNVHLRIHSGEKPFVCEVCGKAFGRIDHKTSHMKTHSWNKIKDDIQINPADFLQVVSSTQPDIQQPSAPLTSSTTSVDLPKSDIDKIMEKIYKCPECGKMFSRKDHMNRHVLIHSGAKPYDCDICAKAFSRKDNKYKHMASCLYMNFGIVVKKPMANSGEEFIEAADFMSLEQKVNEKMIDIQNGKILPIEKPLMMLKKQPYPFEELPQSKDGAVEILVVKKEPQDQDDIEMDGAKTEDQLIEAAQREFFPYQCEVCNKKFMHKNHLVRHAMLHTGEKPFKCDQCDKGFYRKEHLQRHVVIHTGLRPYKCNFCDKSFFQISQQMKHILEHVNGGGAAAAAKPDGGSDDESSQLPSGGPYPCERCDKVYARKSHLKRHYLVHAHEKPFKCEVCGQGFSRLEHKKRHMAIHTNEKRYNCEFCEKKFTRPDHMLAHIKTHRNVKPYKCNHCGQRFETSKEKVLHLRTHTGVYRCDLCPQRFELFVQLTAHRQVIHKLPLAKEALLVGKMERFACPVCFVPMPISLLCEHLKAHISDEEPNSLVTIKPDKDRDYDDEDDDNEAEQFKPIIKMETEYNEENSKDDDETDYNQGNLIAAAKEIDDDTDEDDDNDDYYDDEEGGDVLNQDDIENEHLMENNGTAAECYEDGQFVEHDDDDEDDEDDDDVEYVEPDLQFDDDENNVAGKEAT